MEDVMMTTADLRMLAIFGLLTLLLAGGTSWVAKTYLSADPAHEGCISCD